MAAHEQTRALGILQELGGRHTRRAAAVARRRARPLTRRRRRSSASTRGRSCSRPATRDAEIDALVAAGVVARRRAEAGAARRSRRGRAPRGSVPYARPPCAAEAGRAEELRDGRIAVPQEQRRLQEEREPFGDPPRRLARPRRRAPRAARGTAASSRASRRGELDLGEHGVERLRRPPRRPQHVERVHVAGALPERVQRRLAVEPRQAGLLDVAVAAEALERLGDERGRRPCRPSTSRPRSRAGRTRGRPRRARAPSRSASTVAASESRQRSASTFCISGCSASTRPNADRCAAWCVASATARRMRPTEPSTQSKRVRLTISMIVADAASLLADPAAPTRRRAGSPRTRSSGCRACPSAARSGARCARRRAGRAGSR